MAVAKESVPGADRFVWDRLTVITPKKKKALSYREKLQAFELAWEESDHPRANDGEFTESGGGGGKRGESGAGEHGGGAKPKTPPTTTAKPSPTSSAPAKAPTPKPAGPGTATTRPAPTPEVKAALGTVISTLPEPERQALLTGYQQAQAAGEQGSVEEFFATQAALYQHAQEGDPRFHTWLSWETLDRVQNDPAISAHLNALAGFQQQESPAEGAAPPPQAGTSTGTPSTPSTPTTGAPHAGGGGGKGGGAGAKQDPAVTAALAVAAKAQEKPKGGGGGGGKDEKDKKGKKAKADAAAAAAAAPTASPAPAPPAGGPVAPSAPGTEAGPVGAQVASIVGAMAADEQQALIQGFVAAAQSGYDGTLLDYFVQQAALYQHAQEGDPRLGTWFSGDTADKILADPALWAQVQAVAATQQQPQTVSARYRLDWDESLHPRDEAGRFGAGGGTAGTKGVKFRWPDEKDREWVTRNSALTAVEVERIADKKDGGKVLTLHSRISEEVQKKIFGSRDPDDVAGQIVEDLPGDEVRMSWSAGTNSNHPDATVMDLVVTVEGDPRVKLDRQFIRDPDGTLTVYHDRFTIPKEAQGKGLAKVVMADSYQTYKELGVDKVETLANLDRGGYAWAKFGFKADNPKLLANVLTTLLKEPPKQTGPKRPALSEAQRTNLLALIDTHKNDPRLPWHLAGVVTAEGRKIGRELLYDMSWFGTLDMHDRESTTRLEHYVKGH